jgi:hypothetical protein
MPDSSITLTLISSTTRESVFEWNFDHPLLW